MQQPKNTTLINKAIHAEILQHIDYLNQIAQKMEMDDSGMMGIGLYKTYAFEIEDTANEIRRLLLRLCDKDE